MTRTTSAVRAVAVGLGLAVVVAASMSLAACGSDEPAMPAGANFTRDQASRFVIARGDFPSGYEKVDADTRSVPCDSGWLANQGAIEETANEAALRRELLALGPQACHLSVYEKTVRDGAEVLAVTGFQVIAVVFPDPESASKSLPLFRESLSDALLTESFEGDAIGLAQDVAAPGLGDESTPGITRGPARGADFTATTVDYIWRVRNVAIRLSGGYGGAVSRGDVLEVAKNLSARVVG